MSIARMGLVAQDIHGRTWVCLGKDHRSYWCFAPAADDPRQLHRGPSPAIYGARYRETLEARYPGVAFPDAEPKPKENPHA